MDPLALLLPPRCAGCRTRAAPPWCGPCGREAERLLLGPCCPRCAATGRRPPHAGCWPADGPVGATTARFDYGGIVAATVVAAKVTGRWSAWPGLGRQLGGTLAAGPATSADVVAAVPTDPRRRRQRGFDHAALLAGGVAAVLGLPVAPLLAVRPGLPDRGATRRDAPDGAGAPSFGARSGLDGARVLLVDDVLTTGATAAAAAGALVRAGAAPVHVAVLARAGDHALAAAPLAAGPTAEGSTAPAAG